MNNKRLQTIIAFILAVVLVLAITLVWGVFRGDPKLDDIKGEVAAIENTTADIETEVDEIETKLDLAAIFWDELKDEVRDIANATADIESEVAGIEETTGEINSTTASIKSEVDDIEKKLDGPTVVAEKLVGVGLCGYQEMPWNGDGPPLYTRLDTMFIITNPDSVGNITIDRLSIFNETQGLVFSTADIETPEGEDSILTPHEIWQFALSDYGLAEKEMAKYTVEVLWSAAEDTCPLSGWFKQMAQMIEPMPIMADKLVGAGMLGWIFPGQTVAAETFFGITNPDSVGNITLDKWYIWAEDGTEVYNGTADQIKTPKGDDNILTPHEVWQIQLSDYVGELPDPAVKYTVEIFWHAEENTCPLTGWLKQIIIDLYPYYDVEISETQMVNLEQFEEWSWYDYEIVETVLTETQMVNVQQVLEE